MKKKLIALVCALALAVGLVGCSLSTPDSVGTIGDVDIPSGLYLLCLLYTSRRTPASPGAIPSAT